jgi:catechol 2,3-dioxygenase-like lactoylglutathione lyase family enzyme
MTDQSLTDQSSTPDVVVVRPFVPSIDFEKSLRFYVDLGFTAYRIGDQMASVELGPFSFLLQDYHVEAFAGNFMMQLMVNDLERWWKHIQSLDLAGKYGVRPPSAPALQPWGLTVAYVVDPSGILWHFVQKTR